MSLSIEQLRELSQKIADNPDAVYDLEPEQSIEVRKYINPLGNVVNSKKVYANMSIINWRERYLRKLHMTAMIGYLNRVALEYTPDEELERENIRFESASAGKSGDELVNLKTEHENRIKLITSTAKGLIRRFLNRNFNYNPDNHLRGSHSENKADSERKPTDEAIRTACAVADRAPSIDAKLAAKPDATYKYLRTNLLTTYQAAVETTATLKAILGVILNPDLDRDDLQGILLKRYKQLLDLTNDMKKIAEPLATADNLGAWKMDPPTEVFHQFDRYLTNHYEQIREVVQALYNEKSDFEYAVILYDSFKTPEAAREYRVQHEGEFRTDVFTIENNAVSLLGPFKENRQRVDYYNKNTEVMKRMMEQMETDHRLGKDLMEKQVKTKKKKNIEEAGPDAPGLAAYSKTMNIVQELGAKKVLSSEEMNALAEAKKQVREIKDDYEVPDDTVQVDMFFPQENADGTTTIAKTKFYTQAEAPLHMQEGSQYTEQYQPKRGDSDSLDTAYRTKTIIGRNGQKLEIRVPAKDAPDSKTDE